MNTEIYVHSGGLFNPISPDPDMILIEDIAHALAHQCRFAGHCQRYYSVAEHSVYVSQMIAKDYPDDHRLQLTALMHDASYAYLVDVPRPIKQMLPQYIMAEIKLMSVIAAKFGFQWPLPKAIHQADRKALRFEIHQLIHKGSGAEMVADPIRKVKAQFLSEFNRITKNLV